MPIELPKFKGWTVDARLRQFRKVKFIKGQPSIEFVDFDTTKGRKLLEAYQNQ